MTDFTQIPMREHEKGLAKTVAVLPFEPEELAARLGLTFERAVDNDYGEFVAAVLMTPTGKEFALVRYRHNPSPGTEVFVNERSRDLKGDLEAVVRALDLGPHELRWTHPDAAQR